MKALGAVCVSLQKEPDDMLFEVYLEDLSDLDIGAFEEACRRARRELKFFPKPSELRELAGAGAPKPAGRALLALEQVRKAIRDHGRRGTFDFRDPLIHACIRTLGGWNQLCNSDPDWTTQKWTKTWDSLAGAELPTHVTGAISGGEPGPARLLGPVGDNDQTPPLQLVAAHRSQ